MIERFIRVVRLSSASSECSFCVVVSLDSYCLAKLFCIHQSRSIGWNCFGHQFRCSFGASLKLTIRAPLLYDKDNHAPFASERLVDAHWYSCSALYQLRICRRGVANAWRFAVNSALIFLAVPVHFLFAAEGDVSHLKHLILEQESSVFVSFRPARYSALVNFRS